MYPQKTTETGVKKLVGHVGTFYYVSANDPETPDRSKGIQDDAAVKIAEAFEERCDGSAEQVGRVIVEMKQFGGIKHDDSHGTHFFHVRRKSGSNVALEIVRSH